MEVPEHRKWMDNRVGSDNGRVTNEFLVGINEFLDFACAQTQFLTLHKLRCPCQKCKCMKYQSADYVRAHLCMKRFMDNYYYWTNHNESKPHFPHVVINDSYYGSSGAREGFNDYEQMVMDAAGPSTGNYLEQQ